MMSLELLQRMIPSALWRERRRGERFFANDEVVVYVMAEPPFALAARVLDVSYNGLRVAHQRPLEPKTHVRVLAPALDFVSQVVWTRQVEGRWESGLSTGADAALRLAKDGGRKHPGEDAGP